MKLKMFIPILTILSMTFACAQDLANVECQRNSKIDYNKEQLIIKICDTQKTLKFKTQCISKTEEATCNREWTINHYPSFSLTSNKRTLCSDASKELQDLCYRKGWDGN